MSNIQIEVDIDEDGFDLFATLDGRRAGHASCTHDDAHLCIRDLEVLASFRRRGIGSRLLAEVINKAAELEMEQVWGSITADDIATTPYLLAWYKRSGFIISEPDAECIETAAKKISRTL